MRRSFGFFCLVFLFLLSGGLPAVAHVKDTAGYSTVTGAGNNIAYALSLEYEILARTVNLGPKALEATDDVQRREALNAGVENVEAYLETRVMIFLDGVACEPHLTGTGITTRDDKPYAQLDLVYSCPGSAGNYLLKYDVFAKTDAVAEGHANLVDYQLAGRSGRTVMDDSHREFSVGEGSALASSARFGLMGIEHILSGLDHVLFVVALMLGATTVRKLLAVVSMFTAAHSVTLIAALFGWVTVPASIVEPLIALSIAFVAIDNLLGATQHRLPVVFAFGLLHGLGFAGSLKVTDDFNWNLVLSLLSFNIGIEAGQALLLLAVFPLLLLGRRIRWSVHVVRGATLVVAAFGLVWFVERFFFA
ncbi:HupE/UreJ family protein [Saccharopolyspora sp. NPDC002376]